MPQFNLALIQMKIGPNKLENISKAQKLIKEAVEVHQAKVVSLPEFFNSPFGHDYFGEYAETIPGPTTDALSAAAMEHKIYLVGGSIPEKSGSKLYNTATVYGPDGSLIGTHRKVHLFDIDIPGDITFRESDSLSAGSNFCIFQTDDCKIGVAICHDIRFPELAICYAEMGCDLIVYPAAFNMSTGSALWELMQRARAVDNQLYVAGAAPARDETSAWLAWGHSAIVSPWGEILAEADHTEQIIVAKIDPEYVQQVRNQLPLQKQRRCDLYHLRSPLVEAYDGSA